MLSGGVRGVEGRAYTQAGIWDEKLFRMLSGAVRALPAERINLKDIAELVLAFHKIQVPRSSHAGQTGATGQTGQTAQGGRARARVRRAHLRRACRPARAPTSATAPFSCACPRCEISALAAEPRAVANIVNAFAKAQIWDEELFRRLSRAARMAQPRRLSVTDCAVIVASFAKAQSRDGARLRDGALFRRMSLIVQSRRVEDFSARSVANIAAAFAHAGVWDRALFGRMARTAMRLGRPPLPFAPPSAAPSPLANFKHQELASIAWAVAKAGVEGAESGGAERNREQAQSRDRAFFSLLAQELTSRGISGFKPQELSNLLWALTSAVHTEARPLALFTMVEAELTERDLARFNPQDLSNLATSLAAFGAPASSRSLPLGLAAVAAEMLRPESGSNGSNDRKLRLAAFTPGQLSAVRPAQRRSCFPLCVSAPQGLSHRPASGLSARLC